MRIGRTIMSRLRSRRPFIAMYHQVCVRSFDPWGLAVSPANFDLQIKQLAHGRTILPMAEFVSRHLEGRLPSRAVAITFDDGYLDNLTQAAPILRRHGVPATLFLATGPMANGHPYWWDELADIVFDPAPMRGQLALGNYVLSLVLDTSTSADVSPGWRAWFPAKTPRQELYYRLWNLLRTQLPTSIDTAIEHLRGLRGAIETSAIRPMTTIEIGSLLAEGTVKLGGHTVDHPDLPSLSDSIVRRQVQRGNEDVAALAHAQPSGFAYPYGRFDDRIKQLVKECGVEWACTTKGGYVDATCDRFSLPRMTATDRPDLAWTQFKPSKS